MTLTQAQSAYSFLDSIAVNTHVEGVGGYRQYADTAKVIATLKDIGIYHIRDGGRQNIAKFKQLGAEGIKLMYIINPYNDATLPDATFPATKGNLIAENGLTSWLPKDLVAAVGKENLDGLENINEVDINLWKYWNSTTDRTPINDDPTSSRYWVKYLDRANRALWASVKNDPNLASLTVLPGSSGRTWTYNGKNVMLPMGNFIDYGNGHYYELEGGNGFNDKQSYIGIPGYFANVPFPGNMTGRNLSVAYGGEEGNSDLMRDCYERPFEGKPMYITECGVHTGSARRAVPYSVHGKYVPRLFAEYFRLGFARSYWYEMVDGGSTFDGEGGRESSFGLVDTNFKYKPGAVQLKAMIQAIGQTSPVTPGSLDYDLSFVMPSGYTKVKQVRQVLLQKSNGNYILMVYHNIGNINTTNVSSSQPRGVVLTHPSVAATLTLGSAFNIKNTTLRSDTVAPTATSVSNVSSYSFPVNDTVTILEISPVVVTPPVVTPPAPTGYSLATLGTNSRSNVTDNGNLQIVSSGAYSATQENASFFSKAASSAVTTTISARVGATFSGGTEAWARGGLMIRETNEADSKMVAVIITRSQGLYIDERTSKGASAINRYSSPATGRPNYVRISRTGSSLVVSISNNNSNWTPIYTTDSFDFASDYRIGFFSSSVNNAESIDVKFDYIRR